MTSFPHYPSVVDKSDPEVFKALLLELAGTNYIIDVLEYGTGFSAVYYPLFLKDNDIPYTWNSIENDKKWAIKINKLIREFKVNSKVWLCETSTKNLKKCGNNPAKIRYSRHPDLIKKKFDLIYVDGRVRNRCLARCHKYLKPDGVVLLDNANRKKYRPGMKIYKGTFIKPWIWRGQL